MACTECADVKVANATAMTKNFFIGANAIMNVLHTASIRALAYCSHEQRGL